MVQIVIQPSFGNADARRHWADTIETEVAFALHRSTMSAEHAEALEAMHPTGKARFWGAVSSHDRRMDTLATGDVVLFTGQKFVRGVGEVGVSIRNAALADSLWQPDEKRGSYHNVYSLRSFEACEIPYEEVWALPGFSVGDNFMGTRFVTDERVGYLLEGLRIRTVTERVEEVRAERALASMLAAQPGATHVIPGEAVNVASTVYDMPERTVLVSRAESLLVGRYTEDLGVNHERTSTPVGLTDLYLPASAGGFELVEAKSGISRRHVREAVGQLLDYAPYCEDVTSLAVLLPGRPEPTVVTYVNRCGIDVIFATGEGGFTRQPALEQARNAVLAMTGHGATEAATQAG